MLETLLCYEPINFTSSNLVLVFDLTVKLYATF